MKITHPVAGYMGPVSAAGRRIWFVGGVAEATNLQPRHRKALEGAGFTVDSPRPKKRSAPRSNGRPKSVPAPKDDAGPSDVG